MKKHLLSLATAAFLGLSGAAASAAPALLDFTVDEGSVPGAAPNSLVADKLNGGYNEILTINLDATFDTQAYANIGQFFGNDGGSTVGSQIGAGIGAPNQYGMYALFSSSGTFAGSTFTGTSGSFNLYIDPNSDTSLALGADGTTPVAVGNNADDYLIAFTTSLTSAIGILGNPGAFDLWFDDFQLTALGSTYFTSPDPFYLVVNVDGDFDNFNPVLGQSFNVVGDVSAVFAVPEPGSLALIGLALAGLSFGARRRKS